MKFKTQEMGKCIYVRTNGSIGVMSLSETDFRCPKCEYIHTEKDYYKQLDESKRGLIHKKCKGCGTKLGITTDIRGDIRVWLKEDEKPILNK